MSFSTAPVVGMPDNTSWPQVFQHHTESTLFVSAFVMSNGGKARTYGHAFIEQLEKLQYDNVAELSSLLQQAYMEFEKHIQSFSGGYFEDSGRVVVWSVKQGVVFLQREDKFGKVLQSDIWKVTEGKTQKNDTFFCGTDAFSLLMPLHTHEKNRNMRPDALAELLAQQIQSRVDTARIAAYVVQSGVAVSFVPIPVEPQPAKEEEKVPPYLYYSGDQPTQIKTSRGTAQFGIGVMLRAFSSMLQRIPFFRRQSVYVRSLSKKKRIAAVSAMLLVILLMLIGIGWTKRQASLRNQHVQTLLAPYQQKMNEAKAKQGIDLSAARVLAKEALTGAQSTLNETSKKKPEYKSISVFVTTAQQYFDSISGEKHLDSLPVFFNFQLVQSGFLAKKSAVVGETAVFLDTETNVGISLNLHSKQSARMEMGDIAASRDITAEDKQIIVLGSDALYLDGKKALEGIDSTKDPAFLSSFGGNAYVFYRGDGTLLKHVGSGSTFSSGTNWIRSALGFQKDTATSFAIDGKVWIGTTDGRIIVFSQGTRFSFVIKGMTEPFAGAVIVYTTSDLQHVYALEASKSRFVVLNKDGTYVSSYFAPELGTSTGVLISADESTAYFPSGSVVYSLNLK